MFLSKKDYFLGLAWGDPREAFLKSFKIESWSSKNVVTYAGVYPWSFKSLVKHVGPYPWSFKSVVKYMGPYPRSCKSAVK